MQKLFFVLLVLLFFSGCTTLDSDMILIDDANYITADSNISDQNFTNLNDTPSSYAGQAAKCVAVKGTEDGLEFIVCASGSGSDTTLDVNVDALASFLSKSYDWNADQNFLTSNIFDLNLGQEIISVNGLDFNLFDLNVSVLSVCSGDSNSVLTSGGLCQDITDFHLSGGTSNFSDLILDDNSSFDSRYILLVDSNNVSRLEYFVIKDFNLAVLNAVDWNGLGIDSNCSVSGSCSLVAYVSDVNTAIGLRLLISDLNDFAGINYQAIADFNLVVQFAFGYDLNALVIDLNNLVYNDVNVWIDDKLAGFSFNDTNVWSEGFLDDQNALVNDLNGGGNNLFNFVDGNFLGDFNILGTLNVFGGIVGFNPTIDLNLFYNKVEDTNDVGRIGWQAINKLNSKLSELGYDSDFNLSMALNFVSRNDWTTIDDYPSACSAGQFVTELGDTLTCDTPSYSTDTNIFGQGSYSDQNYWRIDINAGDNSVFNVQDFNGTRIFIQTTDMNFEVYDKNVLVYTVNGMIELNPDKNELCVGNDTKFCMWTADSNGFIGWK